MLQSTAPKTKLDNLYLKFFKYAVVTLMTLALLSIVFLLPIAAYNYFQTPTPPTPAKAPPERSISVDDLKKFLIDAEKRRLEEEKNGNKPVVQQSVNTVAASQLYAEQVLAVYRCTEEFGRLAEQPSDNSSEAERAGRRERQRDGIERLSENRFRGANWVNAMVTFTCSVLRNPEMAKLKKAESVGQVVGPTIRFHAEAWANIEKEKSEFNEAERIRVSQEILAEEVRVALAKARAVFILSLAGGAFLFFLAMALYLIFAKIEDNLALIHQAIEKRTMSPDS